MDLGLDYRAIRKRNPDTSFSKVYTFNSARKSMSTVIPLPPSEGKGKNLNFLRKIILGKERNFAVEVFFITRYI